MKLWKILGLAGVVGVAATGALVVKSERTRRAYEPDEVRSRLHQRLAQTSEKAEPVAPEPTRMQRWRKRLSRAR
ncbi:MAG: hypothetical protein WBQ44_23100 [Rhodococcus sp. (in: high G+C Gram-positive bacteria)]